MTATQLGEEARKLLDAVETGAARAVELARWMHAHPELSLQEFETSRRYRSQLESDGFRVTAGAAGMETAFLADWGDAAAPLRIALLAEMDALPEIGHACGHSLSGPASLLAADALRQIVAPAELALRVVGCPAEETGVGKRLLAQAGVFDDCDAALMAHASDMRRAHRLFLGTRKLEFVFHGRAAHAAAYPDQGINALDAVISTFVATGLLRQQLASDVRVHGIVSEGGDAPNIIPERAAARFWVRALDAAALDAATERVVRCAQGAAAASGTRLEIHEDPNSSPPLRANEALAGVYRAQLDAQGLVETPHPPASRIGSSDITHVSQVTPTIHPNFPIGDELQLHTRAFADAVGSARGEAGLLEAARTIALTCLALAREPDAQRAVAAAR